MKRITCEQACRIVAGVCGEGVVVITMSTMKTFPGIAPDALFVSCVPMMGGASAMGMGIAVARPDKRVWILDGDASLLMELGSLVTVAEAMPRNLIHILFDNKVQYAGTANLAVPRAGQVDFCAMARAAGYPLVKRANSDAEFVNTLAELSNESGPAFIHLQVEPDPGYYSITTPQREIPNNQFTRMGDEARRVKAILRSALDK